MCNDEFSVADSILFIVGFFLSIVSVIALWITWCILPRWRTLHNYTSVQHITMAALHLMCLAVSYYDDEESVLESFTSGIIFLTVMCWSLASSLIAYFKLVLLHSVKISKDKLLVTIFVYGLAFAITIMLTVVGNLFLSRERELTLLGLYPLFLILILKIYLFISVVISVMSCCKKSMSQRKFGHVVALVGAALLCDACTMLWLCLIIFLHDDMMDVWFWNRMIPQAAFVLLNPSSRAHWKWYFSRRRRMNVIV